MDYKQTVHRIRDMYHDIQYDVSEQSLKALEDAANELERLSQQPHYSRKRDRERFIASLLGARLELQDAYGISGFAYHGEEEAYTILAELRLVFEGIDKEMTKKFNERITREGWDEKLHVYTNCR